MSGTKCSYTYDYAIWGGLTVRLAPWGKMPSYRVFHHPEKHRALAGGANLELVQKLHCHSIHTIYTTQQTAAVAAVRERDRTGRTLRRGFQCLPTQGYPFQQQESCSSKQHGEILFSPSSPPAA